MQLPTFFQRRLLLQSLALAGAAGSLSALSGCAALEPEQALTPELAYDWALEAYIYNYPLVYFGRYRALLMLQGDPGTRMKTTWGKWRHRTAPVAPDVPGAPQTDTLYSSLWLDVSKEPVVIDMPNIAPRYWSIQFSDMFGTTYGLLTRRNFGAGGQALVTGPGWTGTVPAGMKHLPCATTQSFNLLRLFFANPEDQAAAMGLQQKFQAVPLSLWLQGQRTHDGGAVAEVYRPIPAKDDPLADFKTIAQMLKENLPSDIPATQRRRFERLGLLQDGGLNALAPEVRQALERAEAQGRKMVTQESLALPGIRTRNGWVGPRPSIGYYNDGDRMYRAAITLAGTVGIPASENPYFLMQKDPGNNELLHGDRRYTLRFEKGMIPQAGAFWSLHAYDQTYRVMANPINRYSIGDRTKGLQYGADGSLTLYVQADAPDGAAQANWLPVKKGHPFWMVVRAYEPQGLILERKWDGPVLTRLN
jgi:hypothetical protein